MKLKYMVDSVLQNPNSELPEYLPVGVWVASDVTVNMFYLANGSEVVELCKRDATKVVTRLIDAKVVELPPDFMEVHRHSRSPYRGTYSEPVETSEYSSIAECGKAILATLQ